MSKNHQIIKRPPTWVSAHRECEFKASIPTTLFQGTNNGGLLRVVTGNAPPATLVAGDRVHIRWAPYAGLHVIKEVHSAIDYTLETPYTTSPGIGLISYVVLPEIEIYSGYAPGELILPIFLFWTLDLSTIQPRKLVARFKPEAGLDGNLYFDISGYLKTVIEQPYKAGYNDTETDFQPPLFFNINYLPLNYAKVDVMVRDKGSNTANKECELYVANSSVSTADLNRHFVDTNRPLYPLPKGVYFDNGINHYDFITSTTQIRIRY